MNYYIEELSKYDLTEKEIWDRVYGETCDEDLALAVVEALTQGEVGIYENELGVRIEVFETNTDEMQKDRKKNFGKRVTQGKNV